jgi:hypothetical protein
MSTSPTPEQAPAEEQKFDPKAFPQELRAAQLLVAELYTELHSLQARLPWSREPHAGWAEVTERGKESAGREPSPGWDPDDAKAYDKLWEDLRMATAAVLANPWWERCQQEGIKGADLVATRMALKHAVGAVPLRQEDVDATA